MSFDKL